MIYTWFKHDFNTLYMILTSLKHNLEIIDVLNDDGTLLSFQLKLLSFGLNSIQDNILSYVQLVAVVVC